MATAVFVVHDYELDTYVVYAEPAGQVKAMKQIFERAQVKDLRHVHYCLDSDNVAESSEDEDDRRAYRTEQEGDQDN
jgi:hypothetical protein